MLVAFLFVLTILSSSMAFTSASTFLAHPHHDESSDDHSGSRFLAACALSSGTLLGCVMYGMLKNGGFDVKETTRADKRRSVVLDRGQSELNSAEDPFTMSSFGRALRRAMAVMLPFLAAFELGGSR